MEFEAWAKTPRWQRDITVTEKIDGTNAAVIIEPFADDGGSFDICTVDFDGARYNVGAQSRKRLITPGKATDNFGFAGWVAENAAGLVKHLGPGRHFGEWYGQGIQRGYGLTGKRFALFNTSRYYDAVCEAAVDEGETAVFGLEAVPEMYVGPLLQDRIDACLHGLRRGGSWAVDGFANPEGIIIFHHAARQVFKMTLDHDGIPKSMVA